MSGLILTPVFFASISVSLMIFARGLYLYSIVKGETRPHAFSWLIWGAISTIGFAAQVAEGAGVGSWARGFGSLSCFVFVAIALFYKGERNITRGDWITLAIALSAIPLWIITKTPVWSVILVCIIDTVGYLPTARKSWMKPREEPAIGYLISMTASFLSIFSIENMVLSTWLYPAVLTISNAVMAGILVARRQALRPAPLILAALLMFIPIYSYATTAPPQISKIYVDKSERKMDLIDHRGNVVRSYKISLGRNPAGDKQREGDGRTPEGRYIIDARNEKSDFHLSLRISYPDHADQRRAKSRGINPGGAIFIHGKPNGKEWMTWKYNTQKDWTDGCIAVTNNDMKEIWTLVRLGTPITIRP